ncbi:hypothetical protein Dxin01_00198 [Deinococcus xinjiangensis]|uniref:Uncharacterized protein n=1 Tax=Deinococcus xinjiangensis TaxID=457454 RepID=A0ABP9V5C3_9DEIO
MKVNYGGVELNFSELNEHVMVAQTDLWGTVTVVTQGDWVTWNAQSWIGHGRDLDGAWLDWMDQRREDAEFQNLDL